MTEPQDPWWFPADDVTPAEAPTHAAGPPYASVSPTAASGTPAAGAHAGPHDRSRTSRWGTIGVAAMLVLAGVAVGVGGGALLFHRSILGTGSAFGVPRGSGAGPFAPFDGDGDNQQPGTGTPAGPADAAAIARHVNAGIVDITVSSAYDQSEGAGTGMVLTATGEVLTNNHVIAGATTITATDIGNGRTYRARVVGYDVSHDVAVLQLTGASGLATVAIGDSSQLRVGAAVVGVGNAGGRGGTPSYAGGTVVALDQPVTATDPADGTSERLTGLIETDAAIVPGDSGGPLVNTSGQVVGVDTAASSGFRFRTAASRGFAVPINTALGVAREIESGRASATVHIGPTAFLGVNMRSEDFGGGSGALIAGVVDGSPAADAGLAAGDRITSVAGRPVTSPDVLRSIMLGLRAGDTVVVGYVDPSGQQRSTTVTLGNGPAR